MDDEDEIRHRAHCIWLAEGKPEGKAEEHWQRAEQEIARLRLGQSAARLALTALFLPAHMMLAALRTLAGRR
jgi:hypothetical protein